jgi:hypothetical protein
MEMEPDTKDWTWVLERACPECGFDTRQIAPENVGGMIRRNAARWVAVLEGSSAVRERPSSEVWSPLEYACHVRDVFRIFGGRLQRMLSEDNPLYPNWDQDETAVAERYSEQDPTRVAAELQEAADIFAGRFAQVSGGQWERTGRRSDGAEFTVATFARYLIHDPVHHLYDVTGQQQNDSI